MGSKRSNVVVEILALNVVLVFLRFLLRYYGSCYRLQHVEKKTKKRHVKELTCQTVRTCRKEKKRRKKTESSALVTTTAPSTPRSTAHTEQGLPVPARRLPITRPGISQKSPEFIFSANVSTKVSNFLRTSFLVSLLMLSMGS